MAQPIPLWRCTAGTAHFSNSASSALSQIITNGTAGAATNGLSASWAFNEGSGTTVADSSGNGNTGTLNNYNSPQWVPGRAGGSALEFPGLSGPVPAYVSVPDSTTLADQGIGSNITICAWVQRPPASLGNYCSVVAKDIPYDSPPYHRNYEMIFDDAGHILFVFMNSTGTSGKCIPQPMSIRTQPTGISTVSHMPTGTPPPAFCMWMARRFPAVGLPGTVLMPRHPHQAGRF